MAGFFNQNAPTSEQSSLMTQLLEILKEGTNVTFTEDDVLNQVTIKSQPVGTIAGFIELPQDKSFTLVGYARVPFTITDGYFKSSAGTCDVTVAINGTNVTGLISVGVSSTATNQSATANNEVSVGDRVTLTVATASLDLENLEFDIKGVL